jgi:hypothetical protein
MTTEMVKAVKMKNDKILKDILAEETKSGGARKRGTLMSEVVYADWLVVAGGKIDAFVPPKRILQGVSRGAEVCLAT